VSTDEFNELREDVREIKTAILGQKNIGHIGLVARVENHDRRITKLERLALYAAGALFVLGIIWGVVKDKTAIFNAL
jgi:hypothetical protein